MTTALLQHNDVEGEKLPSMCKELSRLVESHYQREALIRFRAGQRLELERRKRSGLADTAADAPAASEGHSELEEIAISRDALEGQARYRGQQVVKARDFDERKVRAALRGIRAVYGTDLTAEEMQWDLPTRCRVGAYLLDALIRHAQFRRGPDEIAKEREMYWAMYMRAPRCAGHATAPACTCTARGSTR